MTFATISLEPRGAVRWLTFRRPEKLNSFGPATVAELDAALDRVERDDEARVLVITGEGRAFSAGGDLSFLDGALQGGAGQGGRDPRVVFLETLMALLNRIERFPKPVIAAVNGFALAGGLELLLCCDLVVAAESARVGDAHANHGLIPGGGSTVRLPRRVGVTLAKHLLYTGAMPTAAELRASGLFTQVVPDAELIPATTALAETIAAKSPLALRRVKQLVHDGLEQPVEPALRQELLMGEAHATSHDMREGVAAFAEKRKPRFTGR